MSIQVSMLAAGWSVGFEEIRRKFTGTVQKESPYTFGNDGGCKLFGN